MNKWLLSFKEVQLTLENIQDWVIKNYLQLFVFNMMLIVMMLLRSAGYFEPYLPLSINTIMFIALIGMVVLLRARTRTLMLVTILLWLFAALLQVLNIDVWAERTAVYAFQSLIIATVLFIMD